MISLRKLRAERDFFLARALHGDPSWVGISSDAMLRKAVTGADGPAGARPYDRSDLGRCEETYRRAPAHLRERMLPTLELFRGIVAEAASDEGEQS